MHIFMQSCAWHERTIRTESGNDRERLAELEVECTSASPPKSPIYVIKEVRALYFGFPAAPGFIDIVCASQGIGDLQRSCNGLIFVNSACNGFLMQKVE